MVAAAASGQRYQPKKTISSSRIASVLASRTRSRRGQTLHDARLTGAVASCITDSSSACPRRELALHASLAHHEDAVRQRQDLRQIARDDEAGGAVAAFLADDLVDLVLGADVDALGRLVEQEHARVDRQPARQHDLLLVAAAQPVGRRLDARRLDVPASAGGRC